MDIEVFDGSLYGLAQGVFAELHRWDGQGWETTELENLHAISLARVGDELWTTGASPWLSAGAVIRGLNAGGEQQQVWSGDYVPRVRTLGGVSLEEAYGSGDTALGYAPARFDGEDWHWLEPDPWKFSVFEQWVEGPGRVWWVGQGDADTDPSAQIRLHADGETEILVLPDEFEEAYYRGIWAGGSNDVWVLGNNGAYHYDGVGWHPAVYFPDDIGVKIRSAGGHNYLQGQTRVYELVNGQWTIRGEPPDYLIDIDVGGPLSLWVAGIYDGEANLNEWDGREWTTHELGSWDLCGVQARAPDDVYVLAYRNVPGQETRTRVLHYDGSQWVRIVAPDTGCTDWRAVDGGVILYDNETTYTLRCN
jgi:hypothetical protein